MAFGTLKKTAIHTIQLSVETELKLKLRENFTDMYIFPLTAKAVCVFSSF